MTSKHVSRWRGAERDSQLAPGTYALITGASMGLGRTFADVCAARGLGLIVVALPGSGLVEAAAEVAARHGVPALPYETDLTAPGSVEAMAAWIGARRFPLSVLINNAGVSYNARFEDSTLAENEGCILLNNLALVKVTHLFLPELRRHKRAYILNVASLAAFFPMPYQSIYAPSKTFILNFSQALREEMRHSPVCVSVLCPNGMPTTEASRRKIAVGGLLGKLTTLDTERVATYAVDRMLAGQGVIIPGLLNQVIAAVSRIAPRALVFAVMAGIWGRTARRSKPPQIPAAPPTR